MSCGTRKVPCHTHSGLSKYLLKIRCAYTYFTSKEARGLVMWPCRLEMLRFLVGSQRGGCVHSQLYGLHDHAGKRRCGNLAFAQRAVGRFARREGCRFLPSAADTGARDALIVEDILVYSVSGRGVFKERIWLGWQFRVAGGCGDWEPGVWTKVP